MGAGQSSEKKSPTKGFYQVTSSPEKTSSPEESPETSPSKSNEAKIKAGGDSLVTPAEPVVVVEVSEEEVASVEASSKKMRDTVGGTSIEIVLSPAIKKVKICYQTINPSNLTCMHFIVQSKGIIESTLRSSPGCLPQPPPLASTTRRPSPRSWRRPRRGRRAWSRSGPRGSPASLRGSHSPRRKRERKRRNSRLKSWRRLSQRRSMQRKLRGNKWRNSKGRYS